MKAWFAPELTVTAPDGLIAPPVPAEAVIVYGKVTVTEAVFAVDTFPAASLAQA